MTGVEKVAKILGVDTSLIGGLDRKMSEATARTGVIERIADLNERTILSTLEKINSKDMEAGHVRGTLRKAIFTHEKQFFDFLEGVAGKTEFEKATTLARQISSTKNGFFLKKQYAEKILEQRPPQKLLDYLGYRDVRELLVKEDVIEAFGALRFVESDDWMHETFEMAYSNFKASDFEERPIELRVLGPQWFDISKKFVAKKHHNVSHLKEFGVIFLNPIKMDIPGKFLRDFALLLHYFHEIDFYSKLFKKYSTEPDFADKFRALLRGDVPESQHVEEGEWLIVQRYLAKVNPKDPRLFLPRVNPEAMHWVRGERDLARFALEYDSLDLELWHDLDWIGGFFTDNKRDELVSFDLEDNAMSLVSFMEGKEEFFTYHQREAMWTRTFCEYVGGEEKMEELLLQNFAQDAIKF